MSVPHHVAWKAHVDYRGRTKREHGQYIQVFLTEIISLKHGRIDAKASLVYRRSSDRYLRLHQRPLLGGSFHLVLQGPFYVTRITQMHFKEFLGATFG